MVEMCGSCFFLGEWVVDMYQRNLEVACIYIYTTKKTSFFGFLFYRFCVSPSNTKLQDNESLNKALFLVKVGRHFLWLIWMFFFWGILVDLEVCSVRALIPSDMGNNDNRNQ